MSHLRTTTHEPLRMEETILLHVRLDYLCVIVWFDIVLYLAVDMLLSTSFIDCFIRKIFRSERKFVLRRFHPVAILSAMQCNYPIRTSASHVTVPLQDQSNDDEASPHPIRTAQQTVLKLHSKHCVSATTTAFEISTIDS